MYMYLYLMYGELNASDKNKIAWYLDKQSKHNMILNLRFPHKLYTTLSPLSTNAVIYQTPSPYKPHIENG